jgi:hypothetical protein
VPELGGNIAFAILSAEEEGKEAYCMLRKRCFQKDTAIAGGLSIATTIIWCLLLLTFKLDD